MSWVSTRSLYVDMLNKLQKRLCRTVPPTFAASFEPLVHCQNVATGNLFYNYCFGRCSSKLGELFLLLYSDGRSTHSSNRLHDFLVAIPKC